MKLKGIINHDTFKARNMFISAKRTTFLLLKSSYVNVLLLAVPFGLASKHVGWPSLSVFILNFVAIVPLAAILSFATEELAEHVGENLGGLLNASFGNAVELIIAIIALKQNQIRVVQTSMLGSILSNSLLVLGCCFIAGGYNRMKQLFNVTIAQTLGSLMLLSCSSMLIPAAFHASIADSLKGTGEDTITPTHPGKLILKLSRGTSIILLLMYLFYLFFQMKTHKSMFEVEDRPEEVILKDNAFEQQENVCQKVDSSLNEHKEKATVTTNDASGILSVSNNDGDVPINTDTTKASPATTHLSRSEPTEIKTKSKLRTTKGTIISVAGNMKEQHLSLIGALVVLLLVTVVVAFCADYMVSSIDDLVEQSGMSKTFVGLVLIPIVGNAAEHVTSVVVAMKDKMDLAIGVAVGSATQNALFVTPLMVLIGWWINREMSLLFTTFETAVMFISVFICNSMIVDGESTYLEGIMLISTYVIIAVAFFFFPDSASALT